MAKLTSKQFDKLKCSILEKIILHMRNPKKFNLDKPLTLDEIAILWAPDVKHVMSKMNVCKIEKKTLETIRKKFTASGIKSYEDFAPVDRSRSYAKMYGATDVM